MANEQNLKPFVKGDKRCNRKGRPKSFDKLRKLAVQIAGEQAGQTELTRVQLMLTAMASSKNSADRKLFLEYAYGKVREELDVTSKGESINLKEEDAERFDRAILTLADALRETVSGKGTEQNSPVDTSE